MLARKLLGGLVAVAATSMMIFGANAPAQAATLRTASPVVGTHSNNLVAPNSVTSLPHCNDWLMAFPKTGSHASGARLPVYTPNWSWNCILETGNNNTGVYWMQWDLNQCYSKNLVVDGIFGTATYNALLAVQRQIGVTVDGIYGPGTRNKLRWYAGTSCQPITNFQGF